MNTLLERNPPVYLKANRNLNLNGYFSGTEREPDCKNVKQIMMRQLYLFNSTIN